MRDEDDPAQNGVAHGEDEVEREALVVLGDGPHHERHEGQAQAEKQRAQHVLGRLQADLIGG